jgi:hypothetical protein
MLRPVVHAALYALTESIFCTEAGPPPRERTAWVVADLEDFLGRAGGRSRAVFLLSVLAVCVLAPLLSGRLRWLPALPLAQRVDALHRFERSVLALPLLAVKALLCLVHYEHPDAAREVGFDGACLTKRALPVARAEAS